VAALFSLRSLLGALDTHRKPQEPVPVVGPLEQLLGRGKAEEVKDLTIIAVLSKYRNNGNQQRS
jgi:hypothetical protein